MTTNTSRPAWAVALAALAGTAQAQTPVEPGRDAALSPVVISSSRSPADRFMAPGSVDVVDGSELRDGQLQINLSEGLRRVPGLVIRNRENYAQDLQVSMRGYGARSTFGVRGIRLFVDGIPASAPDGSGQAANFPLGSADRVEVVRGPLANLYGASSGGAILLYTQDGARPAEWRVGAAAGSDGLWRLSTQAMGQTGTAQAPGWSYTLDVGTFATDGIRPQSAAHRSTANARLSRAVDDGRVTLVLNRQTGFAQDPLGLSRAQFDADPYQTTPEAITYNTRKSVSQTQVGLAWDRALGQGHRLELMGYAGQRQVWQYQAIAPGVQAPPRSSGAVIDLDRAYWGWNARWRWLGDWQGGRLDLSAGLAADRQTDERRGYENYVGTTLGVLGTLRRDETNRATSLDPYLRAEWARQDWTLTGGVRWARVDFTSTDRYIVPPNGDDSGSRSYRGTLPVVGVRQAITPQLQWFASLGRGLETPTLNEAAYRPGGVAGLNTALNAARSTSAELGLRGRGRDGLWSATLFDIRTRDEIVVQNNTGGRSTFQNAGRTLRQGLELSGEVSRGEWALSGAYTYIRARYRDSFLTCTTSRCPDTVAPTLIDAGRSMPGIPQQQVWGQLAWTPAWAAPVGGVFTLEARHTGRVYVNDSNSDAAAGHTLLGLGLRFEQVRGDWTWREFLRVENLTDRRYAGSVIVNDGNGRFFEPGAGRSWFVGLELSRRF